jgi:glycerophosphoryl diester phosphodiesterase
MLNLTLPGRPKPYVMAHRGNSVACPENTLAAFRHAIDDGADIVETDVHVTADGEFVCIHDETVDRTTDGVGKVIDLTLAVIKALSADYGFHAYVGERVPTLAEAIAVIPHDRALAIEIKPEVKLDAATCSRLVEVLDQCGIRARTIMLSFTLEHLKTVSRVAPDIPTGYITLTRPVPHPDVNLMGPLWPLLLLNPLYVKMAHRRGQGICPLDPKPDSRLWLYRALRCDAVLTNNPAKTVRALRYST